MVQESLEVGSEEITLNKMNSRRYELDWLRVFATLLLIPFHTAVIFYATRSENLDKCIVPPTKEVFRCDETAPPC